MAGTLLANVASYTILVGIISLSPPRGAGDFTLLPDTSWMEAGDRRVWFVDPDSERLCSIAINGSQLRTESDERLGRFEWYFEPVSIYAVMPEKQLLVYVDQQRRWRLRDNGRERVLDHATGENLYMRDDIMRALPAVLPAITTAPADDDMCLGGVYFSGGVHYFRMRASAGERDAQTHIAWSLGSWGVRTTLGDQSLHFGLKRGLVQMFCRDPEVLEHEDLVLFRCGGWIMVMDPRHQRVGRLVRGESMVVETPFFSSRSIH